MVQPPNYTPVPNEHLSSLSEYGEAELKLLLALDHLTFGYYRNKVRRSMAELMAATGMSRQAVSSAARSLEERGKIERVQRPGTTIEWVIVVDWPEEQDAPKPPPPAGKDQPEKDKVDSKMLLELAQALSEVTGNDLSLQRGPLFSEAKRLLRAGYSKEQLLSAFGHPEGAWYKADWRGKRGSKPSISQVRSELKTLLEWVPGSDSGEQLLQPPRRKEVVKRDGSGFYV